MKLISYSDVDNRILFKKKEKYLILKRLIDILGSFFALFLFSPILLLISMAIKLENPSGPIFYSQLRIGKYKEEFKIYKFRSMHTDSEEKLEELKKHNMLQDNIMFKMKDDPRITKVGKIIRDFSLDELPQLFNVLKGEMSLVGPRPPLKSEVNKYTVFDIQRLLVKPGCTGLWQVTGRNLISFKEMVKLDLYYIQKQSLIFDFYLIFKTLKVMLIPNKIY